MQTLEFYKLNEHAIIPEYATLHSACFDIHACIIAGKKIIKYNDANKPCNYFPTNKENPFVILSPGQRALIPTGLVMKFDYPYSVRIHPRSGLAIKQGISLVNCEGVIDADYYGELMITVLNTSKSNVIIHHGDRVCQGELQKMVVHRIVETTTRPEPTTDREGGFGSTGK
jgi:dUTP pyrophosphatase